MLRCVSVFGGAGADKTRQRQVAFQIIATDTIVTEQIIVRY